MTPPYTVACMIFLPPGQGGRTKMVAKTKNPRVFMAREIERERNFSNNNDDDDGEVSG